MKKTSSILTSILLAVALGSFLLSCGGGLDQSIDSGATGSLAVRLVWEGQAGQYPSSRAAATPRSAPAGVVTVRFRVTGSGMSEMTSDFAASAGHGEMAGVPAGSGRTLTVQGLDGSGSVAYQGSRTGITVSSGAVYDCGVMTMAVVGGTISTTTTTISTTTTTVLIGVTSVTNVFLDGIVGNLDYFFIHGSTSKDRSKFLVTFNDNTTAGTSHLYMLDANSVANATPALVSSGTNQATITGDGSGPMGATITFRSSWTPDDSKILLSGGDRFYILDANTLVLKNGLEGDNTIAGQNHDALPTTDGKYALLTLRTLPYAGTANEGKYDGEIQLYDVVNGTPIGNPVSVCNGCHGNQRNSVLCGIDGSIVADGDGTYSGTVYIAGHGAHFAKVTLDINPANTTDPIAPLVAWSTMMRVQVAPVGAPASDYWLHDARIDGTTLYWSTYHVDANGMLHYGKLDMGTGAVTADITYPLDARATYGSSIYCASGQTDTHFMPITMTNEGYITVIPKSSIQSSSAVGGDPYDIDNDGDGFTENQGDCNDSDAAVHPASADILNDGIDQDCSGADATTATSTVTSVTGRNWLDRNLGASRVATSYNDSSSYGDLYQWGRGSDGHEKRNSPITSTLSSSDIPGHGNFIVAPSTPADWRSPHNDTLWQGVSGTTNPCPAGFRLPTEPEWQAEIDTWTSNDRYGAFASPLKLVSAGERSIYDGWVVYAGINGYYWSSTVYGDAAQVVASSGYSMNYSRARGCSVRCIED
ncbi:MAG: hypothetical protein KJ950_12640 [Proteobacteria bacterium]|nr:hypothetical protein [Pseudomonadota bacterium]MBU1688447.1 hypothetical protein [Pseudomonadota bacterium]